MANGIILVIDDEPQIQKMLGLILAHAGYEVVSAPSGEKRIGRSSFPIKSLKPCCWTWGLPDMEGFDVLLRIQGIQRRGGDHGLGPGTGRDKGQMLGGWRG